MSRITQCFEKAAADARTALIPYIMAGDPSLDATVELMHVLKESGADLIELGVPFSDPMADGPAIQAAGERALQNRTTLHGVLDAVAEFRRDEDALPVVLMSYLNPIEQMGFADFAGAAAEAGIDGVLVVDLPPEEAQDLMTELHRRGVMMIFLLSLTTSGQRMAMIAQLARGFIYCISLKGVTGSDRLAIGEVAQCVAAIKRKTELPVGVGFGIHDADTAAAVAAVADAIVIGSALVRIVEMHGGNLGQCKKEIGGFISYIRKSINVAIDPNTDTACGGVGAGK